MEEQPRRRGMIVAAVAAVLVLVLGGAGVVSARSGLLASAGAHLPWASSQQECPTTSVEVLAAPAITPVVQQIVTPLAGQTLPDGTCLRVDVQPAPPAATVAAAPVTAIADQPQIWIPDSTLWAGQADAWPLQPVGSLATSPVVLAATTASIKRLAWDARDVSWPLGLSGTHAVVAPDMTQDASALLGMLALIRTLGPGVQNEQRVAATVLSALRAPQDFGSALDVTRRGGRQAPVLLSDEHSVQETNRQGPAKLVTIRPVGLPAQLDYPILHISRPSDDPIVSMGTDRVLSALTGPAAHEAAAAAGFGPPAPPTPRTPSARAEAQSLAGRTAAFIEQIRTLALPSRLLTVMDVSLSMGQPALAGISRAGLASQAAIGAGRLLPQGSAVGLWTFAGRLHTAQPYRRIAAIDLLGAEDHLTPSDHGLTHRDVVEQELRALPRQLSPGGTALYDTTLAALRAARAAYDPRANNSVVVFTDGANDYAGGLTLAQFQQAVRKDATAHPQQGVLLIAIGIGPDADMPALQAMTAAAGGRAYRADSVAALQTVLFDAIAHRPVRH
ncbi:MAG: VWA domain-containing protein [Kineosporiaceae bacterium]